MSATKVDSARVHPRRRPVLNEDLPSLVTESAESRKMSLKKGETFHTPTSPPSADRDPILNIRSLPRRCPTSLEAITASEERMTSILNRLTLDCPEETKDEDSKSPSKDLDSDVSKSNAGKDSVSNGSRRSSIADRDTSKKTREHGHESDSGLGSSVSSNEDSACESDTVVNDANPQSPITSSVPSFDAGSTKKRQLSLTACKQIERYMLLPILKEPKLKPFHPLVKSIPARIVNKQIVCLRDLEKTLLWLAPKFSSSRHTYLNFAEFTIQCLHTSASHLNDRDQRLPADRPYTNGYFLDLVSQVRRYAAMIRATRERAQAQQAAAQKSEGTVADQAPKADKADKLSLVADAALEGGLAKTGKPAELVVMQDGKPISMLTGLPYNADTPATFKRTITFDEKVDEGVQRSMARRKKNAPPMDINQKCSHCDKVFKRPCDLTKHEKTHSRPWKCSDSTCKYFEVGWPTEKERDRHINDKHSDTPALYKCSFKPCTYASKRESNCKQHMEKAHGWVYVRSKNNARGGSKRGSSIQASRTPSVSTPASKSVDFSTPLSGPSPSPHPDFFPEAPFNFNDPPIPAGNEFHHPGMFESSPFSNSSGGMGQDFSFPTSLNLDAFQTQLEAADPNGLIPTLDPHRQSMNALSVSEESVPELMSTMGYDDSPMNASDLNFELDWNNFNEQLPNVNNQDYTAFNMTLGSGQPDPAAYAAYAGQMPSAQLPMGVSTKALNMQGNPMLYSPESGTEPYEYQQHQHQQRNGHDFTLYGEANMNMAHMVPSVAQHQATRQYAQPGQGMFPPLSDHESVLQSWPEDRVANPDAYNMEMNFTK